MDGLIGDREERVLARENVDPVWFVAMVDKVAAVSHATVSDAEHHALTSLGVSAEALTPEANADAQRQRFLAEAADRNRVRANALTTSEVADLLGLQGTAQVRTMQGRKHLYALPRMLRDRQRMFPAWQFVGSDVVAHLGDVLDALPADMHPLDVEEFMSTAMGSLGDRSPLEWLTTGGAAAPVVDLAEQQQYSL